MFPERPDTDPGDKNPQVVANFSLTPGLTPTYLYSALGTELEALLRKHSIPILKHCGMHLAGSEYWTSLPTKERPHTLLLVIELKECDRLKWRSVDREARDLLWKYFLEECCWVRYYIQRELPPVVARPTRVAGRPGSQSVWGVLRERSATHSSLPDLVPQSDEESTATATTSPPEPLPPTSEERRVARRNRRNDSAADANASQPAARRPTRRSFFNGRRRRNASSIPSPNALSTAGLETVDDGDGWNGLYFGSGALPRQRRARRLLVSEDAASLLPSPPRFGVPVTERANERGMGMADVIPSLPPIPQPTLPQAPSRTAGVWRAHAPDGETGPQRLEAGDDEQGSS